MKFTISIETLVYPKPIKKIVGLGYANSIPDLMKRFIHEPDDLVQRLEALYINLYINWVTGIQLFLVEEIRSYAQLMAIIEEAKYEWSRQYGYSITPRRTRA
jgi:hypothetical protein